MIKKNNMKKNNKQIYIKKKKRITIKNRNKKNQKIKIIKKNKKFLKKSSTQ